MCEFKISMKAARVNAKKTQSDIAAIMHVSKDTVGRWENGLTIPKPAQFRMFCEECGIDEDRVFLPTSSLKDL